MEPVNWVSSFLPEWMLVGLIIPLIIWEMVWKGIALWRAGRNAHLVWFICIFIFNTLGILPILYILVFSKKKESLG